MCGIVGCVGHEGAASYVVDGLETLKYRGYDSAGVAMAAEKRLEVYKVLGEPAGLLTELPEEAAEVTTAIGHTRWATHGRVSLPNTHPHTNQAGTIAVVHNGTIENHHELRKQLESEGISFSSETDTEVIPHLLDYFIDQGMEPGEAFTTTMRQLVGAYAVLGMFADQPETLYAARLASPLVVAGRGSEHFAASDQSVLVGRTDRAVFADDHEIFELSDKGYRSWDLRKGMLTTRSQQPLSEAIERATKGEFPHFMLKEIHDSPETVRAALSGRVKPDERLVKLGGLESPHIQEKLRRLERLIVVACGTSYHAGLIGERLIEEVAGLPVEVQLASEFKYRQEPYPSDTAVLAISQSGETADTLAALHKARDYGLLTLGINNTPGSSIDRDTDAGLHCRAGQEVSVASTKAFVSQVTVLAELALSLGRQSNELRQPLMDELIALPAKLEAILQDQSAIQAAAKKYARARNFLYIGRGYEHVSALEGALKLKEISYIHAEGCSAGEMKHGTLALIDEDFPTMAIATNSPVYEKTVSNIQEIKARGGPVIALATEGNQSIGEIVDDVLFVPKSLEQTQPILNAVVLQLFAYHVAVEKGENVDQPRNLAKSVTVE